MTSTLTEQAHQAELLDQLQSHPGWQVLENLYEQRKHRIVNAVAGQVMQGQAHNPEFRQEIDVHRGIIQGINWVLRQPQKHLDAYQRTLDAQERENE